VLYAGSLVRVMEDRIGPAFEHQTGARFVGEGKGSVAAANLILDGVRQPDVFISADAAVNGRLMKEGGEDYLRWYTTFASTDLVLAFAAGGPFSAALDQAARGQGPWHEVLTRPGFRLGRSDPELDPSGYRTLFLFGLAEEILGLQGIRQAVLGDDRNPAQLFPEEELAARLEAGQLDAIVVYRTVAVSHELPFIALPPELNQGDPQKGEIYATQTYRSRKGTLYRGAPVVYTVAILEETAQPAAAEAFVRFLLSAEAAALLEDAGLASVAAQIGGDAAAVPTGLAPLLASPSEEDSGS